MSPLHKAAAEYLRQGLYIFPLTKNSKIPIKGSNGLLAATNNQDIGIGAWEDSEYLNIGLNGGMSGLAMVDIDMNHDSGYNGEESWKQLQEDHETAPSTLEARTPNGGRHLFFMVPEGEVINSSTGYITESGDLAGVAVGIDIKSTGGYVVIAPSKTKDGSYKWLTPSGSFEPALIEMLPDWLVTLTRKQSDVQLETEYKKVKGDLPLDEVKKILEFIHPECSHEVWCKIGMGLKAHSNTEEMYQLYHEWSENYPNFQPNRLKKKWNSFKKDGVSIGTVIYYAKKEGYKPIFVQPSCNIDPSKDPNCDPLIRGYYDSVKDNHEYPDTKEETLCRFFPVADKSGRVYDAALDEEKDLSRITLHVSNAIKDEIVKDEKLILKPWNFNTDYRCRLISTRNIRFDPVNHLKWPFINTYRGLGFEENDYSQYEVDKAQDEFFKILLHVCGDNINHADMVMKWLAFPIQHHNRKCKWNVIAKTPKKGVGKSVLFDDIVRGMYNHLYEKAGECNPGLIYGKKIREVDLLGRFNKWIHRALFAVVEEISSSHKESVQIANMLKDIATSDFYQMEAKRQDPVLIRIYFQMVFLSNHTLPIRLEKGDRRFFVIGTNSGHLQKNEYDYLYTVLKNKPWMMGHVLQQVKDVDRDFGLCLPEITPLHQEMVGCSMSPSERFVALFRNGELGINPTYPFKISGLFSLYETWCESEGETRAIKKKFLVDSLRDSDYLENNQITANGVKERFLGLKYYAPRTADLTNFCNQLRTAQNKNRQGEQQDPMPTVNEMLNRVHDLLS